jgi:hypothetical protein
MQRFDNTDSNEPGLSQNYTVSQLFIYVPKTCSKRNYLFLQTGLEKFWGEASDFKFGLAGDDGALREQRQHEFVADHVWPVKEKMNCC